MAFQNPEIKTYFGQCKCCLSYAYLRNMWDQHWSNGELEIYGKMLVDCFSIKWNIEKKVDKICEACITRLRDAFSFKNQLLQLNNDFLQESTGQELLNSDRSEADSESKADIDENTFEDVEFLEEEILLEDNKDENDIYVPDSKPKTRKRKRPKKLPMMSIRNKMYKQYSEDDLNMAVEAVRNKQMSKRHAAIIYNVPRKTVVAKASKKTENETLEQRKMKEFIDGIKAVLLHTNATPFRRKGNHYYSCFFCPPDASEIKDPEELRTHTHSVHKDKVAKVEFGLRPYHTNQMIRVDVGGLICNCNTEATWQDMLDHLEAEHNVNLQEGRNRIVPYKLTADTNEMPCALCDLKSSMINIDAHMNTHIKNYICGECGETFITEGRFNKHFKTHQIGVFPCHQCDKIFSRHLYRAKHIERVHEKKLICKCAHCDEKFPSKMFRDMHIREQHKDKLKYRTCKECNKTYLETRYFQHVKRLHNETFSCKECGKCFENLNLLKEHRFKHFVFKPFVCDKCQKAFFSQRAVNLHKKQMHT